MNTPNKPVLQNPNSVYDGPTNPPSRPMKKNTVLSLLPTLGMAIGLALSANNALATTNWQYLGGGTGNYNPANGAPNSMTDKSNVMPSDLLSTILSRLPEGQPIGNDAQELLKLTNDESANIFLNANANVKISYIHEGAGYLNSVGFFKFPKTSLATLGLSSVTDTIIFPNFSDNVLQFGKTVDLGNFVAGDAIGFTIAANAWVPYVAAQPAIAPVAAKYKKGKLISAAKPGIPAVAASGGIVDTNKAASKIFRTIKRFNPEPDNANNLRAHTILFAYPEKELLVLGFEDLNRENASNNDYGYGSDNDFNDVMIAIHVSPFSAVDCAKCNLLVDTCKYPITRTPIPAAAFTQNGKVNICHNTASATNPIEYITISENAVQTHLTHHDDTFQIEGKCPPITAEVCPADGPKCDATSPDWNTTTQNCEKTTTPTCDSTSPDWNATTQNCEKEVTCESTQVKDAATNTCITPPKHSGESGPISWREITTSPKVAADVNKTAKAAAKAAANGNGNGNGNNQAVTQ